MSPHGIFLSPDFLTKDVGCSLLHYYSKNFCGLQKDASMFGEHILCKKYNFIVTLLEMKGVGGKKLSSTLLSHVPKKKCTVFFFKTKFG